MVLPTGYIVISSPAVANGVVYISSNDGNLYALDASTGQRPWSYGTTSAFYSSPAVANGEVYIGSYSSSVYAFGLPGSLADHAAARLRALRLKPNRGLRPSINLGGVR
jgi:outer membrane protein assembly factor BamB